MFGNKARWLAVACSLLGGMSACAPALTPSPTEVSSPSAPVVSSPTDTTPSAPVDEMPHAQWWTLITPPPPLAAYADYIDGPPDDIDQTALKNQSDSRQAAIASCMAAAGFHYTPVPYSPVTVRTGFGQDLKYYFLPQLPSNRDDVVRYGYGVMGTPEQEDATRSDAAYDPNAAYQATLSAAAADAYSRALFGDYNNPATAADSCSGKALTQFPDPSAATSAQEVFQAQFGGLVGTIVRGVRDAMGQGVNQMAGADPRLVVLNQQWEACMVQKGHSIAPQQTGLGPGVAMNIAQRTRPDGTVGPLRLGVPTSDIPVDEKSLQGTAAERAVAMDDFDCRTETDYMSRLRDIRVSTDNQLIARNQAQLDALVAASASW